MLLRLLIQEWYLFSCDIATLACFLGSFPILYSAALPITCHPFSIHENHGNDKYKTVKIVVFLQSMKGTQTMNSFTLSCQFPTATGIPTDIDAGYLVNSSY